MKTIDIPNLRHLAHGVSVLYVEDDSFQHSKYREFLDYIFTDITSAYSGQEALNLAIDNEYDLIISDVDMPGMDGMELIKKIKEFIPEQIVLFISGYHDAKLLQKAIELGIDGYVYKPLDVHAMSVSIESALKKIVHNKEMAHALKKDSITSAFSFAKFEEDVEVHDTASMIMLKIKDFKSFNDYYGYEIGNVLLDQTANFVINSLKNALDITFHGLYRITGTHFVILSDEKISKLEPFLSDLIVQYESYEFGIDDSMLYFELDGAIVERNESFSLSQADNALRRAEKENRIIVYDANGQHHQENQRKLVCKDKIKRAVHEKRFVPYYQPIVNNHVGSIQKYESLVRLIMPDGEVVSPMMFLPIAKETKMYSMITKTMIEQVLEDFKDSQCSVSINLSIEDIKHLPTCDYIFEKVTNFSDPRRLIFELIESEEVSFYHIAQKFFTQIKEFGCQVAIDDFGSGFSNFEHLVRLNVDYLKIDGSLIRSIDQNQASKAIVEMLANFGHRMGIRTIAEYVSSAPIQHVVNELSVDESQGFFFSTPLPFNDSMKSIAKIEYN